ncbi:hypothetical protein BHM03_00043694, partial [Ensete ventricosum]
REEAVELGGVLDGADKKGGGRVRLPGWSGVHIGRGQGPPNGVLPVVGWAEQLLQPVVPLLAGAGGEAASEGATKEAGAAELL